MVVPHSTDVGWNVLKYLVHAGALVIQTFLLEEFLSQVIKCFDAKSCSAKVVKD